MFPIDVEKADLSVRFRGYGQAQVDALLERVIVELETLRGELSQAHAAGDLLRMELEGFRSQENTLKEALILAQRVADEVRANAQREAEMIQEQARQRGRDLTADTENKLNDLRWEMERLRIEKQKFINAFRSLLETQLRDLAEQGGLSVVEGTSEGDESEARA